MNPTYQKYYDLQNQMRSKVIKEDKLPAKIRTVAGVDVAYDEANNSMIGAIVLLDASSLKIVEQAHHEMEITFQYVPGLFSFREIPAIKMAYYKLSIKPDIIVCDAQGIAHPNRVGMATHLGIELDVPTIGCAKKRLIGEFDKEKLNLKRASQQSLIIDNERVGVALRTQDDVKPMYVSIGHRISLETAIHLVLKLCNQYRLPETTRMADQLVNKLRKERNVKKD